MGELEKEQEYLLETIINAEKKNATDTILNWAEKTSFKNAFSELLEPVLSKLGDLWFRNELSLAQAFLAGKVAEDIFNIASKSDELSLDLANPKGTAVIGNIEDDFHSFGRKLVVIFLRLDGWKVYDLGNDVLPKEFVDKAVQTNARVIGVSAMIYNTAISIIGVRKEIDKRNLTGKIQLCVGGAVFNVRTNLVQEVGADGTADNAIKTPELFNKLQQKSFKYE
ncbi:MAG: cobalamin-dependent protein [Bacteroidetes bacterium]|nr:cobalamin-dependent protein [Bacteroidota bacterium]